MGIDIYTPDLRNIVHETKVDFMKRIIPRTVHIVQYDSLIPVIKVLLYLNGSKYSIVDDPNVEMKVRWSKKGNLSFIEKDILGCNSTRDAIYFSVDSDMTNDFGTFNPILELVVPVNDTLNRVGSSPMIFEIDANPIPE